MSYNPTRGEVLGWLRDDEDVVESKLCVTHGGFTTILVREKCVFASARVGKCRWVEGYFISENS